MKNKSFGALKKLKSLYHVAAIAVPLLSSSVALAVAPTYNDFGAYYDCVQILKANMSGLKSDVFQIRYNGKYQKFIELQKAYAKTGTIYYKLGKNGTWSNKDPNLKSAGKYDIYYYVLGNSNYNNFGNVSNPKHVTINVVDWGNPIEKNGIINYVDSQGKTSAEVNKRGMVWVNASSGSQSNWYGIDNSSGIFETGSRFWVKWLSKESDGEEYQKYFEQLDENNKRKVESGRLLIFLTGVTKPDGVTAYKNLPQGVPYYIQLGNNFTGNDVAALFISPGADKPIELNFNTASYFKNKYKGLEFPDSAGRYARLVLNRFMPVAIYESSNIDNAENYEGNETEGVNDAFKTKKYIYKNYLEGNSNSIINPINDICNINDYEKHDNVDNNPQIPESKVKFLIVEEIIFASLLGVTGYISKVIRKNRKNKNSNSNKSL